MARPKRINLPHLLYHVFSRTNSGDSAFPDRRDMGKFLEYLAKYADMFEFRIHAFCLMPTHFHLLVESGPRAELSEFMKRLLTAYTIYYNRRHARHGHLFQGRFKSLVVDKSDYLLALSRYIHLNPAATSGKRRYETYEGSSMKYFLGGGEPPFLHTGEILAWFNKDRRAYADFVREGLNEKTSPRILEQRYIGGKAFVRRMRKRIGQQARKGSRAQAAGRKARKAALESDREKAETILNAVADYFSDSPGMILKRRWAHGETGRARSVLACLLCECLPWNQKQIANFVGLVRTSNVRYHLKRREENEQVAEAVREIQRRLTHGGKLSK